MRLFLNFTFYILCILTASLLADEKHKLFLKAKLGDVSDTHMISMYSRLCDLIKQRDFGFIKNKSRQDNEKEFIIASLKIIDGLLLNEKNDPSDFICLIRNFPNLEKYVIDKDNVEIVFIVMFIQFTLFVDEIGEFPLFYPDVSDRKFVEKFVMEDLVEEESIPVVMLEKRIDTFFDLSKQMLKKENGEFWNITEVFDLTTKFMNDKIGSDCFEHLLISNGFIEAKNEIAEFSSKSDSSLDMDNDISFVSITPFCVHKVFKDLIPDNQLSLDDTSMIYAIGNSIVKDYPDEGTIFISATNSKLLLEFIARFFICSKSYSPESIRISVFENVNDLKVMFNIKGSSLDYISDLGSNKIRYLISLNKILHRRYIEFYINLRTINHLKLKLNMVRNETRRRSDENRNRNSFRLSASFRNSFRNQITSVFRGMTKRKNSNASEECDFVSESNFNDTDLSNTLVDFSEIFDSDDISLFLYQNAVLNSKDLQLAEIVNSFPEYAEISKVFFEYNSSGYDLELLNDEIYNNTRKEIEIKQAALTVNYDVPSIISYFKTNVLMEDNEKKIIGRLLISIASYFDNAHLENIYECLIRLRRFIKGSFDNKREDTFIEKLDEISTAIFRSIELSKIKREYIVSFIYEQLKSLMNK